ncbi:hypothetical protein LJB86_02705 [Deltaproteobacteria bacterium OttesenSCG-928-M10]|nr:hypothetical protein [Deltaproteobacteria bacterium OttesenSCG-928-M10]
MKPLITLIREALAERLKQSEELAVFVAGRIYLNRFEAWDEGELTSIGVYVLSEEPISNDLNPSPDERKATFSVDIITREDPDMEERLDAIAALVERLYTLPALGEIIRANGRPDTLLKIDWLGNERGFVPEAELTLGANIMTFSLEYRRPYEDAELPPFLEGHTDWQARAPEGEVAAENTVNLDQD